MLCAQYVRRNGYLVMKSDIQSEGPVVGYAPIAVVAFLSADVHCPARPHAHPTSVLDMQMRTVTISNTIC